MGLSLAWIRGLAWERTNYPEKASIVGELAGLMRVFLDHASTTPLRPEAKSALTNALELTGNPSSVHSSGQQTRALVEDARDQVAQAVGCNRSEVVFTSGGTEANNQAITSMQVTSANVEGHPIVTGLIMKINDGRMITIGTVNNNGQSGKIRNMVQNVRGCV